MEAIALDKKGFKLLRSNSKAIAHKTRMGFNLIEAAIVLAVVGGVIGGIWVSAAAVYENHKVNKTVEGLALVADNIQRLFSEADAIAINSGPSPVTPAQAAALVSYLFPEDWVTSDGIAYSPIGIRSDEIGSIGSSFRIHLRGVPVKWCDRLVTKMSLIKRDTLQAIAVYNDNAPTYLPIPTPHKTAATVCDGTAPIAEVIYFQYSFTRRNY